MSEHRATLLVVSGPSGVGKGTLLRRFLELRPHIHRVRCTTTRLPRHGEQNNEQYRFVSDRVFDALARADDLEIWTRTFGSSRYGIERRALAAVPAGERGLLEVDYPTYAHLKSHFPVLGVMIVAPSFDQTRARLTQRGIEDGMELSVRLLAGREILRHAADYDYVVINNRIDEAVQRLCAIADGDVPSGPDPAAASVVREHLAALQSFCST